jgi:hypothetical protein
MRSVHALASSSSSFGTHAKTEQGHHITHRRYAHVQIKKETDVPKGTCLADARTPFYVLDLDRISTDCLQLLPSFTSLLAFVLA